MERPHRKDFNRLEAYSPTIDRQSEYYSMEDINTKLPRDHLVIMKENLRIT